MADHNELGKEGEELALKYLEKEGYLIKVRNWRFGKSEIDIIAEKDGFVIFVEVKTRGNTHFGEPEEAVTKRKQAQIIKAADAWFKETDCQLEHRFDIVSVVTNGKKTEINHIEGAFYPIARRF